MTGLDDARRILSALAEYRVSGTIVPESDKTTLWVGQLPIEFSAGQAIVRAPKGPLPFHANFRDDDLLFVICVYHTVGDV